MRATTATAAFGGRLSRLGWRPDGRTGAALIGAYALYSAILSTRNIGNLLTEVGGQCAPTEGFSGYGCALPDYVRSIAAVDLVYPLVDLAIICGAVAFLAGRGTGRALMVGSLLVAALANVAGAWIQLSAHAPFNGGIGFVWPAFVSAAAMILLAGFVLALAVPISTASPTDAGTVS